MNIINKIKALFGLNRIVKNVEEEYKMASTAKPGWKTTEFWLKILSVDVPALLGVLSGIIPAKYALIATVISGALYTVSRTVVKAVADVKSAQDAPPAASDVPPAA